MVVKVRAVLDRLLQAALSALEADRWPEAPAEYRKADAEALLHACIAGLKARGCGVEISPYPSWEAGSPALDPDPFYGEFNREIKRVWVYSALAPEEQLVGLMHEGAHFLDGADEEEQEEQANRELVAYLAASAACLELGILDEGGAVEEAASGLDAAARSKNGWWGWEPALQEVAKCVCPLLGEALLDRAASIAGELVALVREGMERCEKPER